MNLDFFLMDDPGPPSHPVPERFESMLCPRTAGFYMRVRCRFVPEPFAGVVLAGEVGATLWEG